MRLLFLTFTLFAVAAMPARAQEREVPYWVTLRADEVNMRVGPSADFPIDWVYRRAGLPMKVVRLNEGWRLVEDPDGARGWIFARLLSRDRGAIVIGEGLAEMRQDPEEPGSVLWKVEPGVVGDLGDCESDWCEFVVHGRKGWIEQSRLWGAGEP